MKSKKGTTLFELLMILAAIALVAFCAVKYLHPHGNDNNAIRADEHLERSEDLECELRERKLAREREEAERAKAEEERIKKREAETAERARLQEERNERRKAYKAAQDLFSAPFAFVKFAPKDEIPQTVNSQKTFWCVFPSYSSDRKIYEINAMPGGVVGVTLLYPDGKAETLELPSFLAKMSEDAYAMTSGNGKVWVGNVRLPVGQYPLPAESFSIMKDNFGKLHQAAVMLGLKVPEAKYNIYLQQKNAKEKILVNTISYNGAVSKREIEEAMRKELAEKATHAASGSKIQVKTRRYRQTVVLYDGTHIKRDLNGITHVPRVYQFHGTNKGFTGKNNYGYYGNRSTNNPNISKTDEMHRKKWQELYNEAQRQEREAEAVERENAAAKARAESEYMRKVAEASRSVESKMIEDALGKCNLVVEYVKKDKR